MHKLYNGEWALNVVENQRKRNPYTLINYGLLPVQCVLYKNVNINNCSFFHK